MRFASSAADSSGLLSVLPLVSSLRPAAAAVLLASCAAAAGAAQEPASGRSADSADDALDAVFVTATARPEARSRIAGTTQTIDREAIERSSARSVTDLLAENAVGFLSEWTAAQTDRKSTRLNSSHSQISYAVFCLKKKKRNI